MKVTKVLAETPARLVFTVEDAGEGFINALRRAVISEIPAFAIDEVTFFENTSPMFNEYVANRLALVPLSFEESLSDDAKITFELNVEATDGPRTVYSGELSTTDPKIKVFSEKIPLIKLGKGQRLRLEATAIKGTPKEHAKFQSALASYGALPDFRVSAKCSKCKECVPACPQKIITEDVKLVNPEKCLLCEACAEACPKQAIKVKPEEGKYVFFVESFNNLTARQQLERALDEIDESIAWMEKELK